MTLLCFLEWETEIALMNQEKPRFETLLSDIVAAQRDISPADSIRIPV